MTTPPGKPEAQRPRNVKRGYLDALVRSGLWASLSKKAKALLPVIYHHANSKTGRCHPGIVRLMEEAGLSRQSVVAATKELVGFGIVRYQVIGKLGHYELVAQDPGVGDDGHAKLEASIGQRHSREHASRSSRRQRVSAPSSVHVVDGHEGEEAASVSVQSGDPVRLLSSACPSTLGAEPVYLLDGDPTQPSMDPMQETQSSGADPGPKPQDHGATLDPAEWFACSICANSGQGWAGQVCLDPEHLRQELRREGLQKATIFAAKYQPLVIRSQVAAIRYLKHAKPEKIKRPATFLAQAIKGTFDLPDELAAPWDTLMAQRLAAISEGHKAERERQRERTRQVIYDHLDPWLAQLDPEARRTLDLEVHAWASSDGARKAEAEGFVLEAPALEGPNRFLLVWFFKLARPELVQDAPELARQSGISPTQQKESAS